MVWISDLGAMVVALDREACFLYKQALHEYLPPEASDVVMTVGSGEDRYARYRRSREEEEKLLDRFRDPADPLKVLVVTSKLLTGFEAPNLQCMYLESQRLVVGEAMRSLVRISRVSVIALVLVACSGTGEDTSTTVAVEIPADWITDIDETAGSSLPYPSEWEVFALNEAATADLFAGIEDALPGAAMAAIPFQAGFPVAGGFNPNVTLTVEVLPDDDIAIDLYTEVNIQGIEAAFPSYSATKEVKTVVGGREAILDYGSYALSEVDPNLDGRWWLIQLLTVDGLAGWGASCGQGSVAEPDLDECEAVVRTFELSSA